MPLPIACEKCKWMGGYWVEGRGGGVQRCDCERGRALAAQDAMRRLPPLADVDPIISEESAAAGVSMMSVMKFFPSEAGARVMIGEELRSMCTDDFQVIWLARRMSQLFSEWPGLPSLRAVFCSKYVPLDRRPAENEAILFPDGVPPEIPHREMEYRALPAGSDDSELDAEIRKLAGLKRLN